MQKLEIKEMDYSHLPQSFVASSSGGYPCDMNGHEYGVRHADGAYICCDTLGPDGSCLRPQHVHPVRDPRNLQLMPYETWRKGEWSPTDRILVATATDFWFEVNTEDTRQRLDLQASIAAAEAGETLTGYDGHRYVKWRKRSNG